jgi:hypothetical protein
MSHCLERNHVTTSVISHKPDTAVSGRSNNLVLVNFRPGEIEKCVLRIKASEGQDNTLKYTNSLHTFCLFVPALAQRLHRPGMRFAASHCQLDHNSQR